MDLIRFVCILQPGRNELMCAADAIGDAGIASDLTLIDQSAEGFVESDMSEIEEYLGPHPAVEQMPDGMFGAANIDIDLSPVITGGTTAEFSIVAGIHVPEEVPATAGISGHGIDFTHTALVVFPVG